MADIVPIAPSIPVQGQQPRLLDLANFVKVWRRLEVDQDTLTRDGLCFLRKAMS